MRRKVIFGLTGVAVAAAVTAAVVTVSGGDAAQQPGSGKGVVLAEAKDRMPSQTASDWVTYADHVVTVTAVSEEKIPPAASEIERGEGLIGRKVRLKVDRTLWSRPGAAKPAPEAWTDEASGWAFHGNRDNSKKFATEDRPRIEVGHSYIIAIAWQGARCSPGDTPEPAHWVGLGEGSVVPYDNNTVGEGEMEGRKVSAPQPLTADGTVPPTAKLEDAMAGKTADDLAAAIKAAKPEDKKTAHGLARSQDCT
ncbi:hypothetical protein [Streptomyces smyrnaeus]|uniref:hypothetical protein n=1 Tax=Streptomyces smyrnaeus TaxID=1387713 RepID=UPI0033DD1845